MTGPTVRHLLDVSALLQIVSGTKELTFSTVSEVPPFENGTT